MCKRSKGMTLIEVLIAMGLAVIIMAATFSIVRFSADTYDKTVGMVNEDNNTYDAVGVINRYIREAKYCTVSQNGRVLYLTVDDSVNVPSGASVSIRFVYDIGAKKLYLDKMDGSSKVIISDDITAIEWEIKMNGVRYTAYTTNQAGTRVSLFYGFAVRRGR